MEVNHVCEKGDCENGDIKEEKSGADMILCMYNVGKMGSKRAEGQLRVHMC